MESANKHKAMLEPGCVVDHFRVLRRLGMGGMGEVYLARDTKLGRRVALKVIRPRELGSKEAIRSFLAEARITARFSHPHIVTIHAVGEYEGSPYLALEYLEGQSLKERLRDEKPGLLEALRIGLAVAEALKEAHHNQVLHRDLKPANVLIPKDGRIRVVDFGVSKVLSPAGNLQRPSEPAQLGKVVPQKSSINHNASGGYEPLNTLTVEAVEQLDATTTPNFVDATLVLNAATSNVVGTPQYLAPERWLKMESAEAGDIWALGLILYQLLTGDLPYQGLSFQALRSRLMSPNPAPVMHLEVAPEVQALVHSCLEKLPTNRPSAAKVVEVLSEILSSRRVRSSSTAVPFRGLRAFEEQHADQFFGRDPEVLAFCERLRDTPVLPVVGASGAGKSSFVQAGVIPRLREQGSWLVLVVRPGSSPFEALGAALATQEASLWPAHEQDDKTVVQHGLHCLGEESANGTGSAGDGTQVGTDEQSQATQLAASTAALNVRLCRLAERTSSKVLLFVDQLEELYTLVDDGETRRRFMQSLCAAADDRFGPVRVVFTVREDFLSRLAEGAEAREVLSQVTVMRSPGPEALRDILVKPLEATGFRYEDPQLVEDLVRSVQHESACLPLVAFAAQTLWERRDKERKVLLRDSYEGMGGVGGALAEHADGVLQGMTSSQVQLARQILLHLVTSEGTRRVVTRQQVLEGLEDEARAVLTRLTEARLISVRKGHGADWESAQLELVHEALIERWRQLTHWLDESREDMVFLAEVGQAAELWHKRGRSAAEVWHGAALVEAERKAQRCQNVPGLVEDFLRAGSLRASRQVRRRRILFATAMTLLAVIALAAVGVSLVVTTKEREAQRQRAEAQLAGARAALARGEPFEARARLRLALETGDSRLARSLWWQLARHPLIWKKPLGGITYGVAYSPDGNTVAVGCMDHSIYLLDVWTTGVRILRGHTDQVFVVSYSPDGRYLASGSWGGEIRLWELATGRSQQLRGHTQGVTAIAFSPNGASLASASYDKTVRLWNVETGHQTAVLRGHEGMVRGVTFHPTASLLASAGYDSTIRLWDAQSQQETAVLRGHQGGVTSVSFSPSGTQLASGSVDKTVRLWDIESGKQTAVLRGHQAAISAVAFSPNPTLLVSAGQTVRLWDVKSGRQTGSFSGHGTLSVDFSPDGTKLVAAGMDKTVRLWDVELGGQSAEPQGHEAGLTAVAFSPLGKLVASAGYDKTVRFWDLKTGRQTAVLKDHEDGVLSLAFSSTGALLASGSKKAHLWDVESGGQIATFFGHDNNVRSVAFSPDDTKLATGSIDKTVRLWDIETTRQTAVLRGHESAVLDVAFSSGGTLLASGSLDKTVRLWDIETTRQTAVLRGHENSIYGVAFSPDGALLASGSADKTVRLWDAKTHTGRILGRLAGRVYRLHFHPDSRRLVAPSSDGTARIWDISTGGSIELSGHRAEVNMVRFSPDGKLAATASDDGTVRLWDADTGRPVWRAPLLRPKSLELFTHNGWTDLDAERKPRSQPASARFRTAVEDAARLAAESLDGTLLCLGTHAGALEIWDLVKDEQLVSNEVPGLTEVVALPDACIVLAEGIASVRDRAGGAQVLREQATAVAWDEQQEELLLAAGGHVWVHGPGGETRDSFPANAGATAVGRIGPWIAVGYKDGNIELLPTQAGQTKPTFTFEGVPASPVVRIIPGPLGTIIAGYADGLVGMWSLQNGAMLEHSRLHGPVVHLLIHGSRLYAASILGTHMTWDLSMFHIQYCELLRQVWQKVSIVWEAGLPVLRQAPRDHRCQP